MTKHALVLSVDHVIFGNGNGDVRQHVVLPTGRMADICEQFGMPLTVFFEAEEYLAFERERGRKEVPSDQWSVVSDQ